MQALQLAHIPEAELTYSQILRAIAQTLEDLNLKGFDIKCQDGLYFVQGWHRNTPTSVNVQRRYTMDDLMQLEAEARKRRRPGSKRPDPLNLSQILRTAGNYVDFQRGRLLRLEWQYQSDKVQCLTIQYEACEVERQAKDLSFGAVEEVCIHIYKETKKARPLSVRPVFYEAN